MTAVSSEWSKLRTRQVPLPSAASTNALFEILLLPGVAIVTGDLVGMALCTVTASHKTLRITSSATTDAFSSYVFPILLSNTIFFAGPEFFLSIFIMSSNLSTPSPVLAGRARHADGQIVRLERTCQAANSHLTENAKLTGDFSFEDDTHRDALAV